MSGQVTVVVMCFYFAEGQFCCKGGQITLSYFGQKYTFTVDNINQTTETVSYTISISGGVRDKMETSVSEDMSNLSLSELSGIDTSLVEIRVSDYGGCHDNHSINISSTPNRKSGKLSESFDMNKSIGDMSKSLDTDYSNDLNNSSVTEKLDTCTSNSDLRKDYCTPKIERTKTSEKHSVFFTISSATEIIIKTSQDNGIKDDSCTKFVVRFDDLGGLDKQIEDLREMIELPLKSPDLFKSYGLPLPRGVLIYGPPGTGKTTLARAVCTEAGIHVVNIAGPEIWSKFYGETEAKLRRIFKEAEDKAPCLIVIDEIDAVCPRRDTTHNELEKRVVASLLTLMDGIEENNLKGFVMVLGITSKPDVIDPALRRPGRFDREIEIGVPSAFDRREILLKLLKKINNNLADKDIHDIADAAHGYVGADLVALCKEASLHALKSINHCNSNNSLSTCIAIEDLKFAMSVVQPSAMREVQLEVPKVLWSDIGGQAEVKLKLKQAVEWPLKHPEAFTRMGIAPPRGILLYGPPGCSKTMIAKALATESGLNFIAVKVIKVFEWSILNPFALRMAKTP